MTQYIHITDEGLPKPSTYAITALGGGEILSRKYAAAYGWGSSVLWFGLRKHTYHISTANKRTTDTPAAIEIGKPTEL